MVRCGKPCAAPFIPQFFAGKTVFITGATGFMGKVLIERLLWTCPDIGRLYLLVRNKKDVTPDKRLHELKRSQVFDVVREKTPSQLEKLHILPGDITQPDLGMTTDSLAKLTEVSVVFHSAATLKFDEAMGLAVQQNVLSVMRLMDICDRLPHMQAFVHVSTAYSNAELSTVEEKVYPPPAPLQQLLAVAEAVPEHLMADITAKYIFPKPNTYTFTKAMAESAVQQHGNRGYPIAIFRPTVVISSAKHPFPGWIENLNGPSGVVVGAGKGLMHVFWCRAAARADMLPVDIAIDCLIAAAWEVAHDNPPEVRVYNCSTFDNPTTWGEFEATIRKYLVSHPLDKAFWYPSGASFDNKYVQKTMEWLIQTVPLHVTEYALRTFGIKTKINLITISDRLQAMSNVLRFFALREWEFKSDNVKRLWARLSPEDRVIYNLDVKTIDWDEQFGHFVKGTRKYLLKEKDQDLAEARQHIRRMFYVHYGVILFAAALILRLAFHSSYIRYYIYGLVKMLATLFSAVYSKVVPA